MKHTQADLELAIQHVTETEARVVGQLERIERLKRGGQPTESAENLLAALLKSLDLMKIHPVTLTDTGKPDETGQAKPPPD